ncbi:MAG: hypothetical protein PUC82_05115 [bacterium]|nr:hypothetical protein [bacterium]
MELADNSKEKQEEFKDRINDSQYIEFKQGGPHTTSGLSPKTTIILDLMTIIMHQIGQFI